MHMYAGIGPGVSDMQGQETYQGSSTQRLFGHEPYTFQTRVRLLCRHIGIETAGEGRDYW